MSKRLYSYAASEGVISLIVKTESAALRDGDKILGLIKATDTMHNGRTQGLIAPSAQAQARLQRSLLRLANLEPAEIEYVYLFTSRKAAYFHCQSP
jgi:acyl transferase domain-containing protein